MIKDQWSQQQLHSEGVIDNAGCRVMAGCVGQTIANSRQEDGTTATLPQLLAASSNSIVLSARI